MEKKSDYCSESYGCRAGRIKFCFLALIALLSEHHPQVMNEEGKLIALNSCPWNTQVSSPGLVQGSTKADMETRVVPPTIWRPSTPKDYGRFQGQQAPPHPSFRNNCTYCRPSNGTSSMGEKAICSTEMCFKFTHWRGNDLNVYEG